MKTYILIDPDAETFEILLLKRGKWTSHESRSRGKLPGIDVVLDLDALWKHIADVRKTFPGH